MASALFDRRRINGPETSHPPLYEDELSQPSTSTASAARTSRAPTDLRPIFLKTGLITAASGSAYLETERTKLAVAVYGPRQVKNAPYSSKGRLNVECKYAPFASATRRAPLKDAESPHLSTHVAQALLPSLRLELLPKMQLDVHVTILEDDSGEHGLVSAIASTASAALASAGVEMKGLVVGVTAAMPSSSSALPLLLDPTSAEARAARAQVTLCALPALGSVSELWVSGALREGEEQGVLEALMRAGRDVHGVLVRALVEEAEAERSRSEGEGAR